MIPFSLYTIAIILHWCILLSSLMINTPNGVAHTICPLAFMDYSFHYVHDTFRRNNCSMSNKWKSNDTDFSPIYYTMKQNVIWNNHSVCVCDTFILIYFNVFRSDEERRNVIRHYLTQGMMVDGKRINYIFTVVSPINDTTEIEKLKKENTVYGDILISMHEDNRRLLPITVLDTFLWIRDFCKTAKYVVKTDGDTWVHLDNLVHYVKSLNMSKVFSGEPHCVRRGKRIKYHEVYAIPYDYPEDVPFVPGGGYILSQDLIPFINIGVQYLDVLFPSIEDAIITKIINKAGVQVQTPREYILYHHYKEGEAIHSNVIFAHNMKSIKRLKEVYNNHSKHSFPSAKYVL